MPKLCTQCKTPEDLLEMAETVFGIERGITQKPWGTVISPLARLKGPQTPFKFRKPEPKPEKRDVIPFKDKKKL